MRWQQTLRFGIAVFGVGFVVFVFFAMRPSKPRDDGRRRRSSASIARRPPRAPAARSAGSASSAENFRVEYEKAFTYPDGRQKLTGAQVFVDKRGGPQLQGVGEGSRRRAGPGRRQDARQRRTDGQRRPAGEDRGGLLQPEGRASSGRPARRPSRARASRAVPSA